MTSVIWVSSNSIYQVASANHLLCIMQQGSGFSVTNAPSSYWGASYQQTVDIDLNNSSSITPIGTTATQFSGTYNGQSYKISNYSYTGTTTGQNVGLFGFSSGTLKNIYLSGTWTVQGYQQSLGCLAGQAFGNVYNCKAVMTNSSLTQTGNGIIGGMIGTTGVAANVYGLSISGTMSSIQSTYTANGNAVGGVIGVSNGSAYYLLNDVVFSSTNSIYAYKYVGGIIGNLTGSANYCVNNMVGNIVSSISTSTVNCGLGGIVGANSGTSTCSYWFNGMTGNISSAAKCVGGIVGYLTASFTVNYCLNYMYGNLSSSSSTGGISGYNVTSTYNNCIVAMRGSANYPIGISSLTGTACYYTTAYGLSLTSTLYSSGVLPATNLSSPFVYHNYFSSLPYLPFTGTDPIGTSYYMQLEIPLVSANSSYSSYDRFIIGSSNIIAGKFSLTKSDTSVSTYYCHYYNNSSSIIYTDDSFSLCNASVSYVYDYTGTDQLYPILLKFSSNVTAATTATSSNGSIAVSVSRGTSPYTYLWNTGATTSTISNLAASNYTVTAYDSASHYNSVTITVNVGVYGTYTSNNVSSYGTSNGSISVVVTGGTGTNTYLWNTGATTQNLSNLAAGSYTQTITSGSVSNVASVYISQPLSVSYTSNNVSTYGSSNASITAGVAGGSNASYSYLWNTGATSKSLSNIAVGTYTQTIYSDVYSNTSSVIVTQPLSVTATSNYVSSYGISNGSITLGIAGGDGSNYSYLWNTGATTRSISNLAVATYSVTTYSDVYSNVKSINIYQPLSVSYSSNNVTVYNSNNGSITTSVAGGTGSNTYSWSDGGTTQNRSNLSSKTYILTLTSAPFSNIGTIYINQPIFATYSSNYVSAYGASNAAISVTVAGGDNSNYAYSWNNGSTSSNLSNLSVGTYTQTITSSIYSNVKTIYLYQPLSVSYSSNNVSTYGTSNASITASVAGGSNNTYTYSWNIGSNTASLSNLPSGYYKETITSGIFSNVQGIYISQPLSVSYSSNNNTSYGSSNASISVSVAGGLSNSAYTYLWNTGATTLSLSNLTFGTYVQTIYNDVYSNTNTVTLYDPLSVSLTSNYITAYGTSNGNIATSVLGGSSMYHYLWNNGAITSSISNLAVGTYTVTIFSDIYSNSQSVKIYQPLWVSYSSNYVTVYNSNNGSIITSVAGGTGSNTFSWSDGSNTRNRSNLYSRTYILTITSAPFSNIDSIYINQPLSVTYSSNYVSTYGSSNAAISVTVAGGDNSNYAYSWNTGSTSSNLSNLSVGTYVQTITSSIYSNVKTIYLYQPLSVSYSSNNVSTYGTSNASITASVAGGSNNTYTYSWNIGSNTASLSNLPSGYYKETITSGIFSNVQGIYISQPLSVSYSSNNNTSYGSSNASISVSVAGGLSNSAYTYLWNTGDTTLSLSNLTFGAYVQTIYNDVYSNTNTVTLYDPLSVSVTSNYITAYGTSNGNITTSVLGGSSMYRYLWNNGAITSSISNLAAGCYLVNIYSDIYSNIQSVNIYQPISVSYTSNYVSVYNSNDGYIYTSVAGGTGSNIFSWSDGITTQNRSNLSSRKYTLTTKSMPFSNVDSIYINQPLLVAYSSNYVSTYGLSNAAISVIVAGGDNSNYTYSWNTGSSSQNLSNLSVGTYTQTITSSIYSNVKIIYLYQPLSVSYSSNNVSTYGSSNASITANIAGGSNNTYTYSWNINSNTASLSNLPSGYYKETITSGIFSNIQNIYISQPLSVSYSSNNNIVYGVSNAAIIVSVAGGLSNSAYSYSWNTGDTSLSLSNLAAGQYIQTIYNDVYSNTKTVNIYDPLSISVTSNYVSSFGSNDGDIITNPLGGDGTYQYYWNNGSNTSNLYNLYAGNYAATIYSDIYSNTQNVNIYEPLFVSHMSNDVTVYNSNDGSLTTSVYGGTGLYSYLWADDIITSDRSNLYSSIYTLNVSSYPYSDDSTVIINQPINVIYTVKHASSYGSNDGEINVTVAGGDNSNYNFLWNNGSTTQSLSNLSSEVYTLTVLSGIYSNVQSIYIQQPLYVTYASNNLLSYGDFSGSIITTVLGGSNSTYTYQWNNASQDKDLYNLSANIYNQIITSGDFSNIASIQITEPLYVTYSSNNPSEYGFSNGNIISTSILGGDASNYRFMWNTKDTSSNLYNLSASTYTVTVQSDIYNYTQTINIYQPIVISSSSNNVTQYNGADAGIFVSPLGGSGIYTYNWSCGSNIKNLNGVPAGTYTQIIYSDVYSNVNTYYISQPLSITRDITNVSLYAGSDGVIDVTISGGLNDDYVVSWSDDSSNTSRCNLSAGVYIQTIMNDTYLDVTDIYIYQPIYTSFTSNNNTAYSASNGYISLISIDGGSNANYDYLWSTGATSSNVINLPQAIYSVVITSGAYVSKNTFIISEPLLIEYSSNNVTTYGNSDGNIVTNARGGNGAFAYYWNDASIEKDRSNLPAGLYTQSIFSDIYSKTTVIQITEPLAINYSSNNPSSYGLFDGSIILNSIGGGDASNYTYSWDSGEFTSNLQYLSAGNYSVNVTSDTYVNNINFVIYEPLYVTLTSNAAMTYGASDGFIDTTVLGGNLNDYRFIWSGGESSSNINNLVADTYTLITYSDIYSNIASTTIYEPLYVNYVTNDASIYGFSNGSIIANVYGGVDNNYNFSWSTGSYSSNIENLYAGDYTILVTSSIYSNLDVIPVYQPLNIIYSSNNVSDYGLMDGSIEISSSGGTNAYIYNWTIDNSNNVACNLSAGLYAVDIVSGRYSTSNIINITQPLYVIYNSNNVSSFNSNDGIITSRVYGGNTLLDYNYLWNTGQTTDSLSNLSSNIYIQTVTNDIYTYVAALKITQPIYVTYASNAVSEYGSNDGYIIATVAGGDNTYNYLWNNGNINKDLNNLTANTYQQTIYSDIYTITNQILIYEPLSINYTVYDASHFGSADGKILSTIRGGSKSYTINWNTGDHSSNVYNLPATTYTYNVLSDIYQYTSNISVYQPLKVTYTKQDVQVTYQNTGTINLLISGGKNVYDVLWQTGQTTAYIDSLSTGLYKTTITSGNYNCNLSIPILEPLIIDYSKSNVSVYNASDGYINVNVSGGILPYVYLWNTQATGDVLSNLNAEIYTIYVNDNIGSSNYSVISVDEPIYIFTEVTNCSEYNVPDGSITLSPRGGDALNYTYHWDYNNSTSSILNNLSNGFYNVIVSSSTYSASSNIQVRQPPTLVLSYTSDFDKIDVFWYDDIYTSYQLKYDIDTDPTDYSIYTDVISSNTTLIESLQPDTTYRVDLLGFKVNDTQQFLILSKTVVTEIAEINLQFNTNLNNIYVDWSDNNYGGAYYKLKYKLSIDDRYHEIAQPNDIQNINLTHLFSSSIYNIQLYGSYNSNGYYGLLLNTYTNTDTFPISDYIAQFRYLM